MKKLLTIAFAIVGHLYVLAQSPQYRRCINCESSVVPEGNIPFNYADPAAFEAIKIADDYGARFKDADPSYWDWHRGLDYNSQTDNDPHGGRGDWGDLLLSLESGRVLNITTNVNYKRIFIQGTHNFGYGHLFANTLSKAGGCYHIDMEAPNGAYTAFLFLLNPVGSSARDTVAIAQRKGKVALNGKLIAVDSLVSQGQAIGPVGTSAAAGEHLHLMSNPNNNVTYNAANSRNPQEFIDYVKPSYKLSFISNAGAATGFLPTYPGTDPYKFRIRAQVLDENVNAKRYKKVFDVNKIKLEFRKDGSGAYTQLSGSRLETRFHIGGKLSEAIYPSNIRSSYASSSFQGIFPHLYSPANAGTSPALSSHPWDEYYVHDFVSRIHKAHKAGNTPTYADFQEDAKYPDGLHKLRLRMTDIKENNLDTIFDLVIDNFLPYIQEAEVKLYPAGAAAQLLARHSWTANDPDPKIPGNGTLTRSEKVIGSQCQYKYGKLVATCTASEPMQHMWASCAGCLLANDSIPGVSGDQVHWTFNFDSISIQAIPYSIVFKGIDQARSAIFSPARQNGGLPFVVPTRIQAYPPTWYPVPVLHGRDSIHFNGAFCGEKLQETAEQRGGPCNCIQEDELLLVASDHTADALGKIEWRILGKSRIVSSTWTFNGKPFSPQGVNWSSLPAGVYCLRVVDEFCCEVEKCVIIKGCNGIYGPNFNKVDLLSHCSSPAKWTVSLDISDPSEVKSISWIPSGPANQASAELSAGIYTVRVTSLLGCVEEKTFTLTAESDPTPLITAQVQKVCLGASPGSISLQLPAAISPAQGWSWAWYEMEDEKIPGYDNNTFMVAAESAIYTVVFTSPAGCRYSKAFAVGQLNAHAEIADYHYVTTCSGAGSSLNGMIRISVANPAALLGVDWYYPNGSLVSGGPGALQKNGLGPGDYKIKVRFAEGCQKELNFTLCCCGQSGQPLHPQCNVPPIAISATVLPVQSAQSQGSITLQNPAHYPDLQYAWTGPGGFQSTQRDIIISKGGEYCVAISDRCTTVTKCFSVTDCSMLSIKIQEEIGHTCPGFNGGYIDLDISGGMGGPYQYQWSHGPGSQDVEDLYPGFYCVSVTDQVGCLNRACFTIGDFIQPNYVQCDLHCPGVSQPLELAYEYVYDEFDCSIRTRVCSDGHIVSPPDYNRPVVVKYDEQRCLAYKLCEDGSHRDEEQGTSFEQWLAGYDSTQMCYYAYVYEICHTDSYGSFYTNVRDKLVSTFIGYCDDFGVYCKNRLGYYNSNNQYVQLGTLCHPCELGAPEPCAFETISVPLDALAGEDPEAGAGLILRKAAIPLQMADAKRDYRLYPNPAGEKFVLEPLHNPAGTCKIRILDPYGQLHWQRSLDLADIRSIEIHSSDWMPGVYIIQILEPDGVLIVKTLVRF